MKSFDVMDVSGGLVEDRSQSGTLLPSSFWTRLHNFRTFGRAIRRRPGIQLVTSAPYAEDLSSLFASKKSTGVWSLYAGAETAVTKFSAGTLTALPISDGAVYASQPYPWIAKQRNDVVYWARRGTGRMKRSEGDAIQNAGIDPPATALTMADGGAGVLTAADYYAIYTYYNSATGAESDPSPVSAVLALGASKKIDYSGMVNSTNGQVDSMRIYRTLPGQTGEYYLVTTVTNFVSVYAGDQVEPADLGDPASFKNGLPPDASWWIEIWGERMWITDGTDLFFSSVGMMESFDQSIDVLNIFREDGHELRVLHAFGSQLMCGKTNAIHFVSGIGGQFSVGTLTDVHGCVAPLSMKSALGQLFWYSGDNVYASDGVTPRGIADKHIKSLLDRVPADRKQYVSAAIYPNENEYRISFPVDDGTDNSIEAVYNYKDQAWSTSSYNAETVSPRAYGDFYDTSYNRLIYGVMYDGHIYDLNSGLRDVNEPILAIAETPDYGLDQNATKKGLRFVNLLISTISGATLTLRAYLNKSATAFKSRTGLSLADAKPWKRYNLSTLTRIATTFRVGIEYSGDTELQLDAYVLECSENERPEKAA